MATIVSPPLEKRDEVNIEESKVPILLENFQSTKKIRFMLGISPKFQPEGDSLSHSNEVALISLRTIQNEVDNKP